jgi:Enoyl-[acyl-carrier-protein] reductase (NADH)
MAGKRGLVMGVANDRSIAWGIARAVAAEGATLAFTYQGEALLKRVKPLADQVGATHVPALRRRRRSEHGLSLCRLGADWGSLDFVVHAIAFSDKEELKGRYVETTRKNFP